MFVLIGRFQNKLIDVLANGNLEDKARILKQVPVVLANSIPLMPEYHIADTTTISRN